MYFKFSNREKSKEEVVMDPTDRISKSIEVLHENLKTIVSVKDWAQLMHFSCPKEFARKFQRYFEVRPYAYLKYIRLKKISEELRESNRSNFEIARKYGVSDEIALNKYINYHMDCSPTEIKTMQEMQLKKKLEKFGSKVR